jgi:hypothetical protein
MSDLVARVGKRYLQTRGLVCRIDSIVYNVIVFHVDYIVNLGGVEVYNVYNTGVYTRRADLGLTLHGG